MCDDIVDEINGKTMNIARLSADFKTAALSDLEKLVSNLETTTILLNRLIQDSSLNECTILSTCNRIECYFESDDAHTTARQIIKIFADTKELTPETVDRIFDLNTDTVKNIRHLFHVTSGTESMVFGENEILGQVKIAHEHSRHLGATKSILNKVFQAAITTGKRVRTETDISKGAYSVSSIAIEGIREHYPNMLDQSIFIVGVGTMGMRCIKKLSALGHRSLSIANRGEEKLDRICHKYQIKRIPYAQMHTHLDTVDIVIMATSTSDYLICAEHINTLKSKPKMIVDLGIPRNVCPDIDALESTSLLSLEGLQKIADRTVKNRKKEMSKITTIIADEMTKLEKWYSFKHANV